jgi:hypothetical protein
MNELLLVSGIGIAVTCFCIGWFGHLVIDAYCDVTETTRGGQKNDRHT